jgi:uncharacterized protein YecE (DUF72 family)
MRGSLPLFDEPSSFDRAKLAATLRELAGQSVYLGTSSWKYEGWLGQVYSEERYMVRGRFSKKRFEENCLAEYAETFPVVCGDFSFYQFPSDEFWVKLFATAPPHLRFAFKVPEEVTRKAFPDQPRYGPRAGQPNETYLNSNVFDAGFLRPLLPWRDRIAVLIFEFGSFSRKSYAEPETFYADLEGFLKQLPRGWRYAVEIRNEEYLQAPYFDLLRRCGVAHVFNAWTRMPPLSKQVEIAEAYTTNFTVVRALLRVGRPYETAVATFSPYDRVQDPSPSARAAMEKVIQRARRKREPAYLFINNRLEGNAPLTIEAVANGAMSHDDG